MMQPRLLLSDSVSAISTGYCAHQVFSYYSCHNLSCSKCHTEQTKRWLEARKLEMLPCHYFYVTVTVPQELCHVLRANQSLGTSAG